MIFLDHGDTPIARPLPDLWVGVVFELGKDTPRCFRRTYSFILPSHTQALPTLSNDIRKTPLLERSIPECRSQSLCLLCIAQSSFQQQSTPNVVFLTRGFYLGRFELPFMRILYQTSRLSPITNAVSSAADLHPALSSPSATPLRSGGYAGKRAPRRCAPTNAERRGRRESPIGQAYGGLWCIPISL